MRRRVRQHSVVTACCCSTIRRPCSSHCKRPQRPHNTEFLQSTHTETQAQRRTTTVRFLFRKNRTSAHREQNCAPNNKKAFSSHRRVAKRELRDKYIHPSIFETTERYAVLVCMYTKRICRRLQTRFYREYENEYLPTSQGPFECQECGRITED